MAIVRHDKRELAIEVVTEIRKNLGDLLLRVDTLQAELDDLEFTLGLANEGEIEAREKYAVMHFTEGETEGHSIEGCVEKGCETRDAEEMEKVLGEEEVGEEGGEEEGPGPTP